MNLFKDIRETIVKMVTEIAGGEPVPVAAITTEPPKDAKHGDMATNAAMVCAKPLKSNPREIAEQLKEKLEADPRIDAVDIAGPGFINLRLKANCYTTLAQHILQKGGDFGASDLGKNHTVNVEYVSANPTGPMHIGHARGAVVGDVLARLLDKAGYDVTKEYYINDAGAQVGVLAQSMFLRYKEACGENIGDIPEGLYPGEYLKEVGQAFKEKLESENRVLNDLSSYLDSNEVAEFAVDYIMENFIKTDLKLMGVNHNKFTKESDLHRDRVVIDTIASLKEKGLVYRGVLEPPKGKTPDDWEPREQLLFKSTEFGDDVDRALQKSDDSYTYFASDLAYHFDKLSRGFDRLILTLGVDHGGYVKRMKAGVQAMAEKPVVFDILLMQLVNLFRNGEPFKMSKRAGNFVTVKDVVDAVGPDVIRFMMLTRKNDAVLDFDLEQATLESKDNPVFYVQYAHARCHSIFRNAEAKMEEIDAGKVDASQLEDELALTLLKALSLWPRVVEQAANHAEPHRIALYLSELASTFHSTWNQGTDNPIMRFIVEGDTAKTYARLALVKAVSVTLASGLDVMGITPRDRL